MCGATRRSAQMAWAKAEVAAGGRGCSLTTVPCGATEIPVGLRNVRIVFVCDDGVEVDTIPADALAGWRAEPGQAPYYSYPPALGLVQVLNLPPRQWVSKDLEGTIEDSEEVRLLHRWRRMEFVAERQKRGLFESKIFRKTLALRPPTVDCHVWRIDRGTY